MRLDGWQVDFLSTEGDKILNTGRQVGKSVVCAMDAGEYGLRNGGKTVLMIAPTERQAYALYEKTLGYVLDKSVGEVCKGKDKPTKTSFKLKNGTKFWCLPTGLSGLGIRFLTISRLYADEAARIPEAVWTAVTPMLLTTGGCSVFLSTPAGKQGYFHDCMANKGGAFDSFTRFQLDSETVIRERPVCESWSAFQREKALERLGQEKARMTALQYAQEYMGRFVEELRQFFPTDLVRSCMTAQRSSAHLLSSGRYYLGVDVAGMGEDENVLATLMMGREKMVQEDLEITRKELLTSTVRRIKLADSRYNYRRIYIDDGGLGVGVLHPLLECDQTRRKVVGINNASRSVDRDSRYKKLLKEDLYTNLLVLMEQGKIELFNDSRVSDSLLSVQAEETEKGMKIFGTDTHVAEALIRAAWGFNDKGLSLWVR